MEEGCRRGKGDANLQKMMDRRARKATENDLPAPKPAPLPNSTSSLYIESTIAKPDMVELCFCASLVVYDLIVEAVAEMSARPPPDPSGASGDASDPYSLFRPREIFSLPSKRSRSVFEGDAEHVAAPLLAKIPTEGDIRTSIADLHAIAGFSPGCLVVALIYIERLRRVSGAMLLASTWQSTLLISILVAQKVWEDRSHMNVDFTPLCPELTLRQLNDLERDFLHLLDFNVGVKAGVYTNWYFRLGALCERNSMRIRPLNGDEASALEIGSASYAARARASHRTDKRPLSDGALPSAALPHKPALRSRAVIS